MDGYRDCIRQFQCESDWIGFIDVDEFLMPNKEDSVEKQIPATYNLHIAGSELVLSYLNLYRILDRRSLSTRLNKLP